MTRLFAPEAPVQQVVLDQTAPSDVVLQRVVPQPRTSITKTRKRTSKRVA